MIALIAVYAEKFGIYETHLNKIIAYLQKRIFSQFLEYATVHG